MSSTFEVGQNISKEISHSRVATLEGTESMGSRLGEKIDLRDNEFIKRLQSIKEMSIIKEKLELLKVNNMSKMFSDYPLAIAATHKNSESK
jgi:phosphoglucomutase